MLQTYLTGVWNLLPPDLRDSYSTFLSGGAIARKILGVGDALEDKAMDLDVFTYISEAHKNLVAQIKNAAYDNPKYNTELDTKRTENYPVESNGRFVFTYEGRKIDFFCIGEGKLEVEPSLGLYDVNACRVAYGNIGMIVHPTFLEYLSTGKLVWEETPHKPTHDSRRARWEEYSKLYNMNRLGCACVKEE